MEFRKAVETDMDDIMKIIREAKEYFNEHGIDQWQNNYPNTEIIRKDIENSDSYVLLKDDHIIATVVVSFEGEKTYDKIYEGRWLSNREYAVIHRIAVDGKYKGCGIASLVVENAELLCRKNGIHSIKVDTHEDNLSMQSMLKKNGFQYCGIIYLVDGSKRLAFEKAILN